MGFCISRFHIAGGRFVSLLAILALVSPPFIGAYSWIVLFGAGGLVRGWLRDLGINMPPIYGLSGILIVFSLKFYPYVYLLVSGALSNVNRSLEEAAEGLGLTPLQRTMQISFPLVLPALSAGGLLALIHAIADFGTPRLLGRGYSTLATEAYAAYSAEVGSNMSMGTTISVMLICVSMLFVLMQRYMSRRNVYHGNLIHKPIKIRLRGWKQRAGAFRGLFHRAVRRAAGDHLGDLLVPPDERSGLQGWLRLPELRAHHLQSRRRGAELADLLDRLGAADRRHRHADRLSRRAAHDGLDLTARWRFHDPLRDAGHRHRHRLYRGIQHRPGGPHRHGRDHRAVDLHPPPALYGAHHVLGAAADLASMEEAAVSLGYSPFQRLPAGHGAADRPRASSPAAC
jgi:ABC-type spermidine/putrescine transport system permease subunit II